MSELSPKQQAMEQLRSQPRILIRLSEGADLDRLTAALALASALRELNKEVLVVRAAPLPAALEKLTTDPITTAIIPTSEYTIHLDAPGLKIDEIALHDKESYEIVLTTSSGKLSAAQLHLSERQQLPFDLIVVVGATDQELRELPGLDQPPAATPVVSIGLIPIEGEGVTSISDPAAVSHAELLIGVLEGLLGSTALSPHRATLLLLGLLMATDRLMSAQATPKALTVAAQLTAAGADRALILGQLSHLRQVPTLKLWGRLLSRLTVEAEHRMVWTYVTREDLQASGASEVDIPLVIDELLNQLESIDVVVVLLQQPEKIAGFVRSLNVELDARQMIERIIEPEAQLSGDRREAYFSLNGRLIERGRELIAKLLGERLEEKVEAGYTETT